ncbi:MAG: hydrogenase expression/formation protein HupK [Pseudomonadota bacterium]
MIIGRSVADTAALLPRLFSLCRAAQATAAQLAFGLPLSADATSDLTREILRDHLIKFHLKWPKLFGRTPRPLPVDWAEGSGALRSDLFGPAGRMPKTPDAFSSFLAAGQGVAGVLGLIDRCFGAGEAATNGLPLPEPTNMLARDAIENSVAARHAGHPVMRAIAEQKGYGPVWRAAACAYDLEACLDKALPQPLTAQKGTAIVPATRGTYAMTACVSDGVVVEFSRVTPTDHLLAEGGILQQSLASLPVEKSALAPLVLEILDPCTPVRLREVAHA